MSHERIRPGKKLSEEIIKQMFLDMFFWVAENRSEWLEEAIVRKKAELRAEDV
jgi:hypothetical protein